MSNGGREDDNDTSKRAEDQKGNSTGLDVYPNQTLCPMH